MSGISPILDKMRLVWASTRDEYENFADFFINEVGTPLHEYSDKELETALDSRIAELKEKNELISEALVVQLDDEGNVSLKTVIEESCDEDNDINLRQELCISEDVHSATIELWNVFTPETLESLARQLEDAIFKVRQRMSKRDG